MVSLFHSLQGVRDADGQNSAAAPVIDLAFTIEGDCLPQAYALPLYEALSAELPWLAGEPLVGVHAIRAPLTTQGWVLSRRARLTLRLPAIRESAARELSGRCLRLGERELRVGVASVKSISAFGTLRAGLVIGDLEAASSDQSGENAAAGELANEELFMAHIDRLLGAMGVEAELICGKPGAIDVGGRLVPGFALALHELSPSASVLLQARGLGAARHLGCGLFLPHKAIQGLDPYPE